MGRRLALGAAGVVAAAAIALLTAEVFLRVGALVVRDRAGPAAGDAGAVRVLALGDSHTFGAYVEPDESYPAQLQRLLDAREPGGFVVINKGIPGFNSSMVRRRLDAEIARHAPDVVIVWAGINDTWNLTETELGDPGLGQRLHWLAARLRSYRLLRVWWRDRRTPAELPEAPLRPDTKGTGSTRYIEHGDAREDLVLERREKAIDDETRRRLRTNYRAIARALRADGIPVIFVAYPVPWKWFETVNEVLGEAAAADDVPLVRSWESVQRLPADARKLRPGAHPNADMYREIATDVVPLLLETLER